MINFIIIIFIIFINRSAFAYLDPGTGSVILQIILSSIAAGAAFVGVYFNKFKQFFKKLFFQKSKNKFNNDNKD